MGSLSVTGTVFASPHNSLPKYTHFTKCLKLKVKSLKRSRRTAKRELKEPPLRTQLIRTEFSKNNARQRKTAKGTPKMKTFLRRSSSKMKMTWSKEREDSKRRKKKMKPNRRAPTHPVPSPLRYDEAKDRLLTVVLAFSRSLYYSSVRR